MSKKDFKKHNPALDFLGRVSKPAPSAPSPAAPTAADPHIPAAPAAEMSHPPVVAAPEPVAAAPVAAEPKTPAAEAVQDGIPGDVIAAIAAAVDFMYGTGTHIVAGVKRISPNRSAWASAGMIESTRPF